MADIVQRVWRSGLRKVRRTAWGYTFQRDGRQVRKYCATWSREQAEMELARAMAGVTSAPPTVGVTFGAMVDKYLAEKQAEGKRSLRNDRMAVARLRAFFGGELPLAEVTAGRIRDYTVARLTTKSERLGRPVRPASVNKDLAILRHMLRLAADREYVARVPRIQLQREPEGRLRFLSEAEAGRLLTECARAGSHPVVTCRSPELLPIVTVALNTGMRRGEILGLTWERVDLARGVLLLERTKSGRRREVPMNRAVYDALAPLRGDRTAGRVFGPSSVRTAFLGACTRARLEDFRFHDLRHTFASWLVMRGRPLKEVQELLGHRSITMTMRYAHLSPDRLRDAVASLEDFSTTSAHVPSQEPAGLVSSRQN
jgi:integrase